MASVIRVTGDEAGFCRKAVGVEDHRRCVGLIAVDDEGIGGRALLDDGVGELLRTEHGLEAREGDVRGDEEQRAGERERGGRGHVLAFQAQQPTYRGADQQRDGSEGGGQAQRGEGRPGEIEEVGHGERVAAHVAMCEQACRCRPRRAGCATPTAPRRGRRRPPPRRWRRRPARR